MCALPDESWNRRLDETYGKLRLEIKERARDRGIYEEEAMRFGRESVLESDCLTRFAGWTCWNL